MELQLVVAATADGRLKVFQFYECVVNIVELCSPFAYRHHMARQRLSRPAVAERAIALVDRDGFEALSLSAVAQALDVGPSALYTHVDGLEGLQYLVAVTATDNLTTDVRNAAIGTSGADALLAMGDAYRSFAHDHPGQFASTLLPPRSHDDELAVANRRLVDVFTLVYGAMGLDREQSYLAARSTRSAIHGFLAFEHVGGTTDDHDDEYEHLMTALYRGLVPA